VFTVLIQLITYHYRLHFSLVSLTAEMCAKKLKSFCDICIAYILVVCNIFWWHLEWTLHMCSVKSNSWPHDGTIVNVLDCNPVLLLNLHGKSQLFHCRNVCFKTYICLYFYYLHYIVQYYFVIRCMMSSLHDCICIFFLSVTQMFSYSCPWVFFLARLLENLHLVKFYFEYGKH